MAAFCFELMLDDALLFAAAAVVAVDVACVVVVVVAVCVIRANRGDGDEEEEEEVVVNSLICMEFSKGRSRLAFVVLLSLLFSSLSSSLSSLSSSLSAAVLFLVTAPAKRVKRESPTAIPLPPVVVDADAVKTSLPALVVRTTPMGYRSSAPLMPTPTPPRPLVPWPVVAVPRMWGMSNDLGGGVNGRCWRCCRRCC